MKKKHKIYVKHKSKHNRQKIGEMPNRKILEHNRLKSHCDMYKLPLLRYIQLMTCIIACVPCSVANTKLMY